MQIYMPNNLSRDQILGSLINDATFVLGDIINQDQVVLKFIHLENSVIEKCPVSFIKNPFVITYLF